MTSRLKIVLIIVMVMFLIYVFRKIKNNIISTKNALIWVVADIIVIFCIIFVEPLFVVADFIEIENVSNMMFFLGFVFMLILCFNLYQQLSVLNTKIINLTQELGILKNKYDKKEDK